VVSRGAPLSVWVSSMEGVQTDDGSGHEDCAWLHLL